MTPPHFSRRAHLLRPSAWILAGALCCGVSGAAAAPANPTVTTLFGRETSDAAFQKAVAEALGKGVSTQVILEARVVRALRNQDKAGLAALLPAAENSFANPNLAVSQLFQSGDDAQGMLWTLRAASAEQKSDGDSFAQAVKEAFWLSPQLAPMLADWAKSWKQQEAMKTLVVPMNLSIGTFDGKKTTLSQLAQGKKAVLLDFWASWCGPCMANMPELKARGQKWSAKGVTVAAMNTEGDAKIAARVRTEQKMTIPWLVEPTGEPLSKLLGIDTIPRAVLVAADGHVLFNGHPADKALEAALAKAATAN